MMRLLLLLVVVLVLVLVQLVQLVQLVAHRFCLAVWWLALQNRPRASTRPPESSHGTACGSPAYVPLQQ
jgi:hypothetical protein